MIRATLNLNARVAKSSIYYCEYPREYYGLVFFGIYTDKIYCCLLEY